MMADPLSLFYGLPLAALCGSHILLRRRSERLALARRNEAFEAGLTEPASLHPVIDPTRCIGCKACVNACPEGHILGLIGGKAQLIEPTGCIGHGACKEACPESAIQLVFGSATRGVDLPRLSPTFETNLSGVFVAGELGGMGLIRNAIEQGRQAMAAIAARPRATAPDMLDVVIVGAGPAGISASLGAKAHNLRYATLEQETFGGTVAHFPRGKLVMTAPAELPLAGRVFFKEIGKEALIDFWRDLANEHQLAIAEHARLDMIRPVPGGYAVATTRGALKTRHVLLAIGRRGTPRRLDVPGEELTKVVYRLTDPEQYRGSHVLVVGGGDSALEAALNLAGQSGTTVTLSYRGESFQRAKARNRTAIAAAERERRLHVVLGSEVKQIWQDGVTLDQRGRRFAIRNDAVIVCAGGLLPTGFLNRIGIAIETKHGTA